MPTVSVLTSRGAASENSSSPRKKASLQSAADNVRVFVLKPPARFDLRQNAARSHCARRSNLRTNTKKIAFYASCRARLQPLKQQGHSKEHHGLHEQRIRTRLREFLTHWCYTAAAGVTLSGLSCCSKNDSITAVSTESMTPSRSKTAPSSSKIVRT